MKLARLIYRPRRGRFQPREESSSGQRPNDARPGLPLYLGGSRKSHGRNFGSVSGDIQAPGPAAALDREPEELPAISGAGATTYASAFGLSLRGRTDAVYSNSFSTEGGAAAPATDCPGCGAAECSHATGTLLSTFRVSTTVTLPSVDDFPSLTPCQRERVRSAISGVLAPHEQQHVTAFQTYNGALRTPFDFKVCRSQVDARVQTLHDGIAATRQTTTQAQSDALDPFNFEVDLDCKEPPANPAPGKQNAGPETAS